MVNNESISDGVLAYKGKYYMYYFRYAGYDKKYYLNIIKWEENEKKFSEVCEFVLNKP